MPTPTYIPLATVTLGSSASSVTFSSIPATFRDLVLVYNGATNTGTAVTVFLNGATTGYSAVRMFNFNNASESDISNAIFLTAGSSSNTTFAKLEVFDYSATDKHKTVLVRLGAPAATVLASANRFPNTNAITQMSIQCGASSFNSGSTFNLYGIAA